MNKAEHLNIAGIGRRHRRCEKSRASESDHLFTWHAGLHNPFSAAGEGKGVGTSFFLCWQH